MTVPTEFFRCLRVPCQVLGLAAVLALGACGGGDRENEFQPTRVIVFGDEASVVVPAAIPASGATPAIPAGSRYTVNGFTTTTDSTTTPTTTTTVFDCNVNRIWVQQLAFRAGFGLPGCLRTGETSTTSLNYAEAGTGVAGVRTQIDTHLLTDTFAPSDLVTVYTGQKDVIDIYATVATAADCRFDADDPTTAGPIAQEARRRGGALAAQVNRIANGGRGGRVLFVTVPGVGSTPFGRLPNDKPGVERDDCLNQLTAAFNAGLRTETLQDGRYVGLLQLDERIGAALRGFYGFANLVDPVCRDDAPLPACTTETLIDPDSDPDTDTAHTGYLWADDLHFGVTMHNVLGSLAINRAFETNPF
jgi:outer membrane lipase/esterase